MRLFPFDHRINKAQFDIDYLEGQRYKDMVLFRRFYDGQHWAWNRENGEPVTTINYCKAIVDIGVDFLMGNGFSIASKVEENKESIVPILNEVWEDNDLPNLATDIALIAGVTGDAWIEVSYDVDQQRIILTALDSLLVFPLWNPHDKQDMLQCTIMYTAWESTKQQGNESDLYYNPTSDRSNELRTYTYRKVYTKEKIREYKDNQLINEVENPVGIIPLAQVKNLPSVSSYGMSDLRDVISLNRELNEKLTEASDIINYSAAPVTIVYGARAATLEKGPRKIWSGLPKDAKVENLELIGDLAAINTFLEQIKTAIFDIASIPTHAFGEMQPVSNTSGVALQITYHPLVRKTNKKRKTYSRGIVQTNTFILKFLEAYNQFSLEGLQSPFNTYVEFPPMLPKDESLAMQLQLEKLNAKLTSRAQVLRDEYNLPEEEIQKRLDEADEDAAQQQQRQLESQYNMEMGMPHNNTETDSPQGAANKEARETANGPDGKGRPPIKKKE